MKDKYFLSVEMDLTQQVNNAEAYIKERNIPQYFYESMFGEFIKIFGVETIKPWSKWKSYKEQLYCLFSANIGTSGWALAFKLACIQCDLLDLYEYYDQLDWDYSDVFDSFILENMMNIMFKENPERSYGAYMRTRYKEEEVDDEDID